MKKLLFIAAVAVSLVGCVPLQVRTVQTYPVGVEVDIRPVITTPVIINRPRYHYLHHGYPVYDPYRGRYVR